MNNITVTIGYRWWFPAAIRALVCLCWLTGWKPSDETIGRFVARGITCKP